MTVVNLNRVRKARAKASEAATAAANRARFGRTLAERRADDTANGCLDALLDGAKIED